MNKVKITILKHDDKVLLCGRKGIVGTVGGYAAEYGENPATAIEREIARAKRADDHRTMFNWINQEATTLCSDPGYYDRQRKIWENAIELEDGQLVWLDGQLLTIKYIGNYSDMGHFTPATMPEVVNIQ